MSIRGGLSWFARFWGRSLVRYTFLRHSICGILARAANHSSMTPASHPISAVPWPYPASLDAVLAAGDYHHVVFENDRVRVLNIRIPPGHTVPLHTHCWPGVCYLFHFSHFLRRDAAGAVTHDSRSLAAPPAPWSVSWVDPYPPHTVENIGTNDLHFLTVELKDASPRLP